METLFIERRGCVIDINNGRLRITNQKQKMDTSFPLMQIRAVIICCDCSLSASLLRNFAKHEIALVCFHPSDIEAAFINVPYTHGNVKRRLNQYQVTLDPDMSARLAKMIVRLKIRQQQNLLKVHREKRADKRTELSLALKQFPSLPTTGNVNTLLGIEGSSARAYFGGLRYLFAPSLGFKGRNKRPSKDQVNSLLSYTYTLLTFEAERAIIAAGLDPMLGVLHQTQYNRASLACDLVELVRTQADEWVVSLFAHQALRSVHFTEKENGALHLNKNGRQIYFTVLMDKMPKWRSRLRWLAHRFAAQLDK